MDEQEQEAVNTDVTNVSDSPSDEAKTEELTNEQRLVRENQELKQNLREQSKKRRVNDDDQEGDEDSEDSVQEELREIKEQLSQLNESKEKKASAYRDTSIDKMYDTAWGKKYAPETAGSEREFVKLQKAFKQVSSLSPIESPEDYMNALRKADVIVSGRPDALMDVEAAQEQEQVQSAARKSAGGPGGSTDRQGTSANSLSQEENALLDKFGVSPDKRKNL